MQKSLDNKIAQLRANPHSRVFILADAKDADMAFGIACPGRNCDGRLRSLVEYRDQIREIVRQGLIDISLMSASTSEVLTIQERLFDNSLVTPAVRANDTTDVHIVRGSAYSTSPSRPFSSTTIDHIQYGKLCPAQVTKVVGANLGLYSVTFNNLPERDWETMSGFKAFRLEAEKKNFRYFLEVFGPNVPAAEHRLSQDQIPLFLNDHIVRVLAGVTSTARPLFLKVPYYGPAAMEELCSYDPSLIVGVLGGSAGTTHDAFHLLQSAKHYGARVALFGRKINAAEHQLSFVEQLRHVADDELSPVDAVKAYHSALAKLRITPYRALDEDLQLTHNYAKYA